MTHNTGSSSANCSFSHPWKCEKIIVTCWDNWQCGLRSILVARVPQVVISPALGCGTDSVMEKVDQRAGLRSSHLPFSTRGTTATQGLKQCRAWANRWIIQTQRQQRDDNEQTETHHRPLSDPSWVLSLAINHIHVPFLFTPLFYFLFNIHLTPSACAPSFNAQYVFSGHRTWNLLIWVWINYTIKWWLRGVQPIAVMLWCNCSNYSSAQCLRLAVFVQDAVQ